jgi:hypothetical protein
MNLIVVGVWVVTIILSLMFLVFGSIKVFAWNKNIFDTQMKMLTSYGLNREIFAVIGIIELFGAVAVLANGNHWIAVAGAAAIMFTSIGAIGVHTIFDKGKYIVPSLVTMTLSTIIFWHNLPLFQERFL